MSLGLLNYFQLLRLKELVRQHQEFKVTVFYYPLRVAIGIVARAVLRPGRHLFRGSELKRRTLACQPPEPLLMVQRFWVTKAGDALANHIVLKLAQTVDATKTNTPLIQLESGNDRIIFVHAFYEREAQEIFQRLDQYTNYDLVLTTSVPAIRDAFLARYDRRRAICVEMPNRGRDILPFLLSLNFLNLSRYRYFIKVHTKRSGHRSDGNMWFRMNLQFLLGSRTVSDAFFALVDEHKPSLYGLESFPVQDHLENNRYWMEALVGCRIEDAEGQFIPGSMFKGTGELLRMIAQKHFDQYPMEEEAGQLDGTLAHALERYMGWYAGAQGGQCLSIEAYLADKCGVLQGVELH